MLSYNEKLCEELKTAGYYEKLKRKNYDDFFKTLIVTSNIERQKTYPFSHILLDGFANIEKYRLRVAEIILNNSIYKRIEAFLNEEGMFMVKDNFEQGIKCMIWGADILVSNKIPDNTILFLSEPKYHRVSVLNFI
jgi:hypothetical protein